MSFQPFNNPLTTSRAVRIPEGLSEDKRADFVKRIRSAVAKQAALAESSNSILHVTGAIRETDGVIYIAHEPAAAMDVEAVINAERRPDISTLWWFTNACLRALSEAEPKRLVHGGLQLRSLLIDRVGRLKLADFGIASIFESICGRDERNRIACDPATQIEATERGLSAVWALLDENNERNDSWIAPYFASEILAGGVMLNPNSDQFSLGVLLYLLAIGVHPLGAELSNPELFGYFVPEPYPLKDERKDWAEAFERQETSTNLAEDQPVLDWSTLVYRLLGNEPGERFPNFAAAREMAQAHASETWPEAERVLGESIELLSQEQYEPFLTSIGPWSENEALPEIWRRRLAECIAETESAKADHAARSAAEEQLQAGREALEVGAVEQARAVVAELLEGLSADDPLRENAVELGHLCDEYEQHIHEKAEELFLANFALAQEAAERGEFTEARMMLAGLLDDPLTTQTQSQRIETLLTEIETKAKLHAEHRETLDAAKAEYEKGSLSGALERLKTLLEKHDLPEGLRKEAESFAQELETERKRHEEHLAIIDNVEQALQAADLATAEETLAMLPYDTQDPLIIERRGDLAGACERLRVVIERKNEIEEQLHRGEAEGALKAATVLLGEVQSDVLRAEIEGLTEQCRSIIEQVRQAKLGDALESLALAETAYQTGDVRRCRQLLSLVLSMTSQLEPSDQKRLTELDAAAAACDESLRRLDEVERRLGQQDFETADKTLAEIDETNLPDSCLARITALRNEIAEGCEQRRKERIQKVTKRLEQAAEHLKQDDIEAAEKLLAQEPLPDDFDDELMRRYEQLREETQRGRRVLDALAEVEKALKNLDSGRAKELLKQLEDTDDVQAAWAVERIDQHRARIKDLEQERRANAERELADELDRAATSIDNADADEADRLLNAARENEHITPQLLSRCEELAAAVAALRNWTPKLAECEQALEQERWEDARRDSRGLLNLPDVPAAIEQRLSAVESTAVEKVTLRRTALSKQLADLEAEFTQRGRRTRGFMKRVNEVQHDPLAAAEHKNKAAKLIEQFQAMPKPRGLLVPALCVIAVAVVGAGWFFMRGDGELKAPLPSQQSAQTDATSAAPDAPVGPTAAEAAVSIARALERIDQAYSRAVADLPADQPPRNWEFYFEPADAFASTLYARDASGLVLTLAAGVDESEIGAFEWNAVWEQRLFAPPGTAEAGDAIIKPTPEATIPVKPDWPAMLSAQSIEQPRLPELRELLQKIAPADTLVALDPTPSIMADLIERVDLGERTEDDAMNVSLVLRGEAGTVSGQFKFTARDAAWLPNADNGEALIEMGRQASAAMLERYAALAEQIETQYLSGQLISAHQTYALTLTVPGARRLVRLNDTLERLEHVRQQLPRLWTPIPEYAASVETQPETGYPLALSRSERRFVLVNVPAGDPIWEEMNTVGAAPARNEAGHELWQESTAVPLDREWRLFYIESNDPDRPVDVSPADYARQSPGGELPSVSDWLLAALKFRSEPNAEGFFDGNWEWCTKGSQLWVCGGNSSLHARFLPPPDDLRQLDALWSWVNNPLVSQPRQRGDGLAGVRTALTP